MNPINPYKKSIAAALTALVTILAGVGVDVGSWAGPDVIAAVSAGVGAVLVYFLPNKADS